MNKYILNKYFTYKKAIFINLKLLIVFTPIAIYKYVDWFRINQEAWVKLFAIIGITLCALKYLEYGEFKWKKNELNFPIFLYILIMSLSLLISKCFIVSLRAYIIFLSYFFIYFLILNNIENRKEFDSFIKLFFISSFFISIYTLFHYYEFISYLKEFGPVISTIGQKNWTSNYLALVFPIMLSFFLLEKSKRKKIFYSIFLSIIYATLMICQSRGIWISISLTSIFAIYIIFKFKIIKIFKENQKWLIILLLIFIVITIIYSTDNPLNKSAITVPRRALSTFDEQEPSINTRLLIWKTTLEMIKEKPIFGLGIGTFKLHYLDYQAKYLKENPNYIKYSGKAREAHNEYLQIWSELGIIGLSLFLFFILVFYSLVINYIKQKGSIEKKIIIFGIIVGITCFLIHCLFTFPLHVPALGSAFFLIIGLAVVYLKNFSFSEFKKTKKRGIMQLQSTRLNIFYTILILSVMVLLLDALVVRTYLAETYAYKGKENMLRGNNIKALSNYKYAEKLDPYNGKILLCLGAVYYNLNIQSEAEKILKKSKYYFNDKNIFNNLGVSYMQSGYYEKAEKELKHAIYIDPKYVKGYLDLGYLSFIQKDYDSAIGRLNKILDIEPNLPDKYIILYNLGIMYKNKGVKDKALEYFLEALKLAPEGSPIIEELEKEIYNIYKSQLDN